MGALLQLLVLPIIGLSPPCLGWTFTQYVQEFPRPAPFTGTDGIISATTTSIFLEVTPTVDQPVPIQTWTNEYSENSNIRFETILLEPGQGEPIADLDHDETYTSWVYSVIMTYTKLPDCLGPASSTTTAPIYLPTDVNDVVVPLSTARTVATETFNFFDGPFTFPDNPTVTMYIEETQIPEPVIERTRDRYMPRIYQQCESNYYFGDDDYSNCKEHPYKISDTVIGAKYECSNGTFYTGLQPYQIVLIFLGGWMVLILAMGIIQSIWRFHDLMRGKQASRGLPIPFICLVPILSFPLLVLHHNGFIARSEEDQEFLTAQWRSTPFRKKVHLWLKYGFSRDYPPMLGPAPVQPLRQPSIAAQSTRTTVHEEPYEAPPPPYVRNETPPPPHPDADVEQYPRNLSIEQGAAVPRPESPPKYE